MQNIIELQPQAVIQITENAGVEVLKGYYCRKGNQSLVRCEISFQLIFLLFFKSKFKLLPHVFILKSQLNHCLWVCGGGVGVGWDGMCVWGWYVLSVTSHTTGAIQG